MGADSTTQQRPAADEVPACTGSGRRGADSFVGRRNPRLLPVKGAPRGRVASATAAAMSLRATLDRQPPAADAAPASGDGHTVARPTAHEHPEAPPMPATAAGLAIPQPRTITDNDTTTGGGSCRPRVWLVAGLAAAPEPDDLPVVRDHLMRVWHPGTDRCWHTPDGRHHASWAELHARFDLVEVIA